MASLCVLSLVVAVGIGMSQVGIENPRFDGNSACSSPVISNGDPCEQNPNTTVVCSKSSWSYDSDPNAVPNAYADTVLGQLCDVKAPPCYSRFGVVAKYDCE